MKRVVRRVLIALVVAVVAVGGVLLTPRAEPAAAPIAQAVKPTTAATRSSTPEPTHTSTPEPGLTPEPAFTPEPTSLLAPSPAPVAPGLEPGPTPRPWLRRLGSPSATPMLADVLDRRLERLRAKSGIPGMSAAILFADGSIWRGATGDADVATGVPVTPDTSFSVASVSKTFTAALILSLVEDGRLSLDGAARSYLPSLPIHPRITVRQLLDHTSGLRDFYFGAGVDRALLSKPARVWNPARSLKYVGKPFAKPGVEWHYSNTNYLVLGMLAEAVGGAPIADQLDARFLEPLGLDDTFYQRPGDPWSGPVARSYRFVGASPKLPAIDVSDGTPIVPFTSVVTAAGGAGSIASSADDLVHWARALYGGDALSEDSRDAMVADIARTASYAPGVAYGLGVQAGSVDGHPTLGHSGRFLGARAVVRWLPRERIAIAVVTNQSRTDPNRTLASLLKLALQPQSDCLTCGDIP